MIMMVMVVVMIVMVMITTFNYLSKTIGSMLILFELAVMMMRTPRVGMGAADDEQLQIAVGDKPGPVVMRLLQDRNAYGLCSTHHLLFRVVHQVVSTARSSRAKGCPGHHLRAGIAQAT